MIKYRFSCEIYCPCFDSDNVEYGSTISVTTHFSMLAVKGLTCIFIHLQILQ